jgi:hypothetical protein
VALDRFELAIGAPHPEALLHDKDIGAEQQEHDDECHRVPERKPRAQGVRVHGTSPVS